MKRFLLNPGVLVFVVLYVASLVVLLRIPGFEAGDVLVVLVLFGIVLPLLAWVATRKVRPLAVLQRRSGAELLLVAGLLVGLSIYLIGGPQAIDHALPADWSSSRQIHFLVNLIRKLVVFVFIPYLLFRVLFGYRWRDFGLQGASWRELGRSHLFVVLLLSAVILSFQFFLGGGAAPVRQGKLYGVQLWLGLPLCFIWLAIEAGLVEEFFFRALVQTRLAAWFRSEITGVAFMALLFGLAHAPGFIFRGAAVVEGLGDQPTALDALAYSIVVLAPGAIVFGVVWARTKNLLAVIAIHAATDLLPNVAGFVRDWGIGGGGS